MIADINNSIVELYIDNKVLNDSYTEFKRQLHSIPESLHGRIYSTLNDFFIRLNDVELTKIFISATHSESLFFRFSTHNSNIEFKFEIFYDYNSADETDIESILHIYDNGEKVNSYFGSIEQLFDIVKKKATRCYIIYGFNTENTEFTEKSYGVMPNYYLPQTVNTDFNQSDYHKSGFSQRAAFSEMGRAEYPLERY
jgi:hypothetical protein